MEKLIILDTDMGPDCDDAGALGLLHILCQEQGAKLLAVTHCTGSPYGCGCIDAINKSFGCGDIPVGTLKSPGFLDGEEHQKYSRPIAMEYPNRFGSRGDLAENAASVMKRALSQAADKSVTLIAIGPMTNLGALLEDGEGKALVGGKVKELVCMAGCFNEGESLEVAEWNIQMDIPAARLVLEQWPSPVVLAPFELGADVITGVQWHNMPQKHPVRRAYALHSPLGRSSWDLTAVWYGLRGCEPLFCLSPKGEVKLGENGRTVFSPLSTGCFRYLMKAQSAAVIAEALDGFWGRCHGV